jgi:hypothetical protein
MSAEKVFGILFIVLVGFLFGWTVAFGYCLSTMRSLRDEIRRIRRTDK